MVARLASIRDIAKDAWDGLANPPGAPHNPLVSHDFFRCLEDSGAATAKTGWAPCHHVEKNVAGAIAAVAPCYLKSHSLGEYVFDQGWAEAFNRAGGRYYPKLQVAVPFTPVTGPRLMAETPAGKATDKPWMLNTGLVMRHPAWQISGRAHRANHRPAN